MGAGGRGGEGGVAVGSSSWQLEMRECWNARVLAGFAKSFAEPGSVASWTSSGLVSTEQVT
jgi:hypothetical protein